MSPYLNAKVVPIEEVPLEDLDSQSATILVVDDEPMVADTVALILSRAGYRTFKAYNGKTALTLALQHRPKLLISDVAMPGMSGVELAMMVVVEVPECKVLLLSGHATTASLDDALRAGYDLPLLHKPVHPTKLLEQIAQHLNRPARRVPASRPGEAMRLQMFSQFA